MILKSVKGYGAMQNPPIGRQAVLKQIWEKKLPKGVKAVMVDDLGYVLTIREKRKK